ncbi:hypothetical protein LNTAR_25115 [Lentisphaera araneosa HTCC2155]|uniref:Transposase IS200-like domain-containing protein n=1 Tax=Lentisphaera araneosa HTCC2155 TaxID=313628 RepID=A6DRV0_9BACT|nr:transposase [Lentisphaera araneosa]EDM25635.1 hypothetical protein LNTAR_25115 [Lentisphaera araneosa HTCC2155]
MNRKEFEDTRNWHSRGFISHYDACDKYQMITYRLADSLPNEVLKQPGAPLKRLGAPHSNADESTQKRKLTESLLDQSYGSCILQDPKVAQQQIEAWTYFDRERYELIAYVVMPNHVHLMIKTYNEWPISKLVPSWKKHVTYYVQKDKELWGEYSKSYLIFKANSTLEHKDPSTKVYLWQQEYWDRFIRDENHFQNSIRYIMKNPIKAGLADSIEAWPWSAVL